MDREPEEQEPVVGAEDMNVADAAMQWVPGQGCAGMKGRSRQRSARRGCGGSRGPR